MKSNKAELPCVCITVPRDQGSAVEELLDGKGVHCYAARTATGGAQTEVTVYCRDAPETEKVEKIVSELLFEEIGDARLYDISTTTLKREDWSEAWKAYFRTQRVSKRMVIKPTWERYEPDPQDIVLEIDPGMSFGTGQHATTRACLYFMDKLSATAPNVPFLDAGCGSGILCLAAGKLGYRPVYGFDSDPQAVQAAGENLQHIDSGPCPRITEADVTNYELPEKCAVVVANILAPVLQQHAEHIVSFVDSTRRPAALILAGILKTQYPEIKRKYEQLGCREEERVDGDEWTSGLFTVLTE